MNDSTFEQQLAWTEYHMVRTGRALDRLPDLSGKRLACSIHLDMKMVPLVKGLLARGAELFVITCNPTTVRERVVAEMEGLGARVEAWPYMPAEAYQAAIEQALAWGPTHLCEMGADLSYTLLSGPQALWPEAAGIQAGLEATGSGIGRLENLVLPYPVFNWDDLPIKEGLHNRHMVGLTTWQTFFARTQLTLHEKSVLVVGYGSVGQGVATVARAYGGTVVVADKDPVRALEAVYDGWLVRPLDEAVEMADVIVTVTGARNVIAAGHIPRLKDGVFLLNCGHLADEIDVAALQVHPHQAVMPFIEAFQVGGKTVYLLAGGSMFNLTAGPGDSLNAFDVTAAVLVSGVGYIATEGARQSPGIHILPRKVWQEVLLT